MEDELIELFNSLPEEEQRAFLEYLLQLIPDEVEEQAKAV